MSVTVVGRPSSGRDGVRTVSVRCPYCRRRHIHGWPESASSPWRVLSHCMTMRPRDYVIEVRGV